MLHEKDPIPPSQVRNRSLMMLNTRASHGVIHISHHEIIRAYNHICICITLLCVYVHISMTHDLPVKRTAKC